MARIITGLIDLIISIAITIMFLFLILLMLAAALFIRKKRDISREIVQLYISIIDFRYSILSTQKDDILLSGFIKKSFCYHFDFDKHADDGQFIDKNIYMYNISVHPDNFLTHMSMTKSAACVSEIRGFFMMLDTIRREGVNIIRAHDPHLLGFNAFALSRLTGVPFIVQICSNYEVKDRGAKGLTFRPFLFKGIERFFERFIMKSSDLVLTDREHYRSFGLIPNDLGDGRYGNMGFFVNDVHYSPPEIRKDLRHELGIGSDKAILLYVGRLEPVKHSLDLVKMLSICLKTRKDLVLLIAGEGELRNDMEHAAESEGILGAVIFLKKLPQEKLKDLYSTADLVCFTSAGFTMIEAALAERCIVAYDFEWHSEFIGNDERGLLVPFGDCNKFAAVVLRALGDPDLRRRLGRTARAYAIKNYSRGESITKEIGFYKALFQARGVEFEKAL